MQIGVIGSGSFGTATGSLLEKKGYSVVLWSFLKEDAEEIEKTRKNNLLPSVTLGNLVKVTNNIAQACENMDLVVTVVPSFATRQTAKSISPYIKKTTPIDR